MFYTNILFNKKNKKKLIYCEKWEKMIFFEN